jgi:Flp pilus assembly protein TadG
MTSTMGSKAASIMRNLAVRRARRKGAALGLDHRGGSVTVMFAGMAIPLILGTGLAVDYSFYVQAQSQLADAADAAALHGVRVASAEFVAGVATSQALTDGTAAANQWWAAELETISSNSVPSLTVNVPTVSYNANTGTFTETVSYSGQVSTHIGAIITAIASWPIGGGSTASIAANSYTEFDILVDNSSSMTIGATPTDIINIENLTVCPPTAISKAAGRVLTSEYSWNWPTGYGYGTNSNGTLQTVPTATPVKGTCYSNFSGGSAQCPYPPAMNGNGGAYPGVDSAGFCGTGYGTPDPNKRIDPITKQIANIPNAPCGFACHQNTTGDDYSLVRNSNTPITLRFDVVQQAMQNVVSTIQNAQKIANQFTVGVYQFNSNVTQVHPAPGGTFTEADNNFTQASQDISNITTPVVPDAPNTNFSGAAQYLASVLAPAGNGGSPTARQKNMFIITDGLNDYQPSGGSRSMGPITTITNEPYCSLLKSLGYNIYVLYTPYYPLPNPFYLGNDIGYVEPTVPPATTNPVIAALQACATTPSQFYQASDTADINNALSLMVQSAIASPGGFSN